jgi:hypothetical protein
MALSNKEQIEVLENVKKRVLEERNELEGLCLYLKWELRNARIGNELRRYIPLFTFENAVKNANANMPRSGAYWWTHRPYDIENRIKFLDWMISQLSPNECLTPFNELKGNEEE